MMTDGWRRTPTALFPACLGALGLGLALRRAGQAMGWPVWPGEVVAWLAALVFVVVAMAYAAKVIRRPGVLRDDLAPPPLRGNLAAGCMGLMLLAAVLLPVWPEGARGLWWAGLILHLCAMVLLARVIAGAPAPVTPVLFLPFLGQIVAPIAGVPLGYPEFCRILCLVSLVPFLAVLVPCLRQMQRAPLPPPARPALAIFVAPLALSAGNAALLGQPELAQGCLVAALLVAALLLLRLRWLTAGGWTPGWAAFTFPLAALTSAAFLLPTPVPGLALLVAALIVIPAILARTLRAWADGSLATRTGAATA